MSAQEREPAPLTAEITLAVCLTVAGFALLALAAMRLIPPVELALAPGGEQHQDAETLTYIATFVLLLPASLLLGSRLAGRLCERLGPRGTTLAVATLAALLAAGLLAARGGSALSLFGGFAAAGLAAAVWLALVAATAWLAGRDSGTAAIRRWADSDRATAGIWCLTGLLILGLGAAVTDLGSVDPLGLTVGVALAAAVWFALGRAQGVALSRRWLTAIDLAVIGLLLLAVSDLVIFRPEAGAVDPGAAFEATIIAFHQNFILGPATEVHAGGAVLVDTASQYGVGPIYLLAGWSELTSLGYGTFGLLDCLLTGLFFGASYALLRLAGVGPFAAAVTMAFAVVTTAYHLLYSVGALPQHGPLRYGMPMIVVLAAVAGARFPRSRLPLIASLAAVGLSSLWAIEAFLFTLGTFAAMQVFDAVLEPDDWPRRLLRRGLLAAGACIAAHILFTLATLAAAGSLPDWGQYLVFLEAFLGGLGDLTYDFTAWSPALAVGAVYIVSAAACVLVVARDRDIARRERPAITAIAATTVYGILLLSYFVDRSADHVLLYVTLPALLVVPMWLSVMRRLSGGEAFPQRVAAGVVAGVAALMIGAAWDTAGTRFERSALAHAIPGGNGFRAAVDRLLDPPPLDPRAPAGQQLLAESQPGDGRVLIVVVGDLQTEILARSERGSILPFSHPPEDSFVAEEHIPELREAVAELPAGSVMLIDEFGLRAFRAYESDPGRDPFFDQVVLGYLAPLQEFVLKEMALRFDLRVIRRGPDGFSVVRLEPRRPRT